MSLLEKKLEEYRCELNGKQIQSFSRFLDLFISKNRVMNLSAIRDEEGVIEKHFIDSLKLSDYFKLQGKVLDIGTGGGFPGIPLAIMNEDIDFTLLDSTRKKIDAVNGFITDLGLKNARGIWGRAEELAKEPQYKKQFDFVVSRATAYLPQIFIWSLPFLRNGGKMIFYKQGNEEEIREGNDIIEDAGFVIEDIIPYSIQGQERVFILIGKS